MSQHFGISVNLGDLDAMLDEKAEVVEEAARPAAQAAAQVLYDEVRRNVASIGRKTGNLAASIYQAYSKDNSGPGRATYHVSWNAKKAPHGHLVEFGHIQKYKVVLNKKTGRWLTLKKHKLAKPIQRAAHPFVRPAINKLDQALEAAKAEMLARLGGVAK